MSNFSHSLFCYLLHIQFRTVLLIRIATCLKQKCFTGSNILIVKIPINRIVNVSLQNLVVTLCTTKFNVQNGSVLPAECVYFMDVRTSNDFPP